MIVDVGHKVPVLTDRYVTGGIVDRRVTLLTPQDFNTRAFDTDAHHQCLAHDEPMRLTLDVLGKLSTPALWVLMQFDVDPPGHKRSAEWDASFVERAACLPGDPWIRWSRNGAAIQYLREPTPVTDVDAYVTEYLLAGVYIAALTGVVIDPVCSDPTHLFRCAHATRDGVLQTLGQVRGSAASPGSWAPPDMTAAEILRTVGWLATQSPAWESRAQRLVQRSTEATPTTVTTTADAYGRGALRRAHDTIRGAADGNRHIVLRREATCIGQLVGSKHVTLEDARKALRAAVDGWTNHKKTLATIEDCLEFGARDENRRKTA